MKIQAKHKIHKGTVEAKQINRSHNQIAYPCSTNSNATKYKEEESRIHTLQAFEIVNVFLWRGDVISPNST